MRVLRARRMPRLRGGRLQGECYVSTWEGSVSSEAHSSLAGRQSSEQLEMRRMQEELFHCRVPCRVSLRVVRHDGKGKIRLLSPSAFVAFIFGFRYLIHSVRRDLELELNITLHCDTCDDWPFRVKCNT